MSKGILLATWRVQLLEFKNFYFIWIIWSWENDSMPVLLVGFMTTKMQIILFYFDIIYLNNIVKGNLWEDFMGFIFGWAVFSWDYFCQAQFGWNSSSRPSPIPTPPNRLTIPSLYLFIFSSFFTVLHLGITFLHSLYWADIKDKFSFFQIALS